MRVLAATLLVGVVALDAASFPLPDDSAGRFAVGENADKSVNVTYDCDGKDYAAAIWSPTFPVNLRSLTLRNCRRLAISLRKDRGGPSGETFAVLAVDGVGDCEIVAGDGDWDVPRATVIRDVESLSVDADIRARAALRLTNVTSTRFAAGAASEMEETERVAEGEVVVAREVASGEVVAGGNASRNSTGDAVVAASSGIVFRMRSNVPLMWFFAVSVLVFLFPAAYAAKVRASDALGRVLPVKYSALERASDA